MTCIATNGKIMAADSRSCAGDLITTDASDKLAQGKDGSVIGTAGDRAACALVRQWFEKGADLGCIPTLKPTGEGDSPFDALILRPDGTLDRLDHHFVFLPSAIPAAIGTGGEIALGAMLAGKTPAEAVELAIAHVSTVGGRVVELAPRRAP
jgi:ATP-dependent protease HslVU (ClpYQ) peptidase subunit